MKRIDKFELGTRTRIAMLGKKAATASGILDKTQFNQPLRDYLTESLWGTIMSRPGLSKKTRMLINVALLAAINRPTELKRYTKGAVRNGASKEEIVEVLLQVTGYCGAPCGVQAFKVTEEALREISFF
jgi:4-carboxymuconolactone decarboxylase